jgi:hypothetical protein
MNSGEHSVGSIRSKALEGMAVLSYSTRYLGILWSSVS